MEENNVVNEPGKGNAVASLVLGIVSIVFLFFFPIVSLICGVLGIVLAVVAKKKGATGGLQIAGLILSIIGTVFGGIIFLACAACAGAVGAAGADILENM